MRYLTHLKTKRQLLVIKRNITQQKESEVYMSGTVKERLTRAAYNKGYSSIRQLAEACGVNYANLVRVSNGSQNGSRTLMKIAEFLNVSFEWLTTGCGLCGVEGDAKLDAISEEFNRVHGNNNTTVNNVNNGNTQTNNVELHTENTKVLQDKIKLLEDKIKLLEERIEDKDRIINLLSNKQ